MNHELGMDPAMVFAESAPEKESSYPNSYVAVPPNGKVCSLTGLKHAHLYRLLLRGPAARHVRVVSLRDPGATRGRLLFHAGDFLRWLDRLAADQSSRRSIGANGSPGPLQDEMGADPNGHD